MTSKFIFELLCNIQLSIIRHPEFFAEKENSEITEAILDEIEPELKECSEKCCLPYIRPFLSDEGARILTSQPVSFLQRFITRLKEIARYEENILLI